MTPTTSQDCRTVEISVPFTCELRWESVKKMQAAGRYVPALYTKNPDPLSPDIRRPWDGDDVYDLRLMFQGSQVHRVMSDSIEDAQRLMQEAIPNLVWASWRQQAGTQVDAMQYQKLLNDTREMTQFVECNYRDEIAQGKHADFASLSSVIFHYLSIERSRWRVRIGKLLRKRRG
jgi:hypothetical protein